LIFLNHSRQLQFLFQHVFHPVRSLLSYNLSVYKLSKYPYFAKISFQELLLRRYALIDERKTLTLQEVSSVELRQDAAPLLVSGFREPASKPDFPCSPSLQLNVDLASLSLAQLTQVAVAERQKLLSSRLKSYLYTVEARTAVIASEPEILAEFLDIYGNLLETIPILFSPDIEKNTSRLKNCTFRSFSKANT